MKLIEGRYKSKEMSKKVQDAILEQYKMKYAKKTLRRPKKYRLCKFNPFGNVNPLTGTIANSEDPDEMQHNAAFHQGLHCLLRQNQSSEREMQYF